MHIIWAICLISSIWFCTHIICIRIVRWYRVAGDKVRRGNKTVNRIVCSMGKKEHKKTGARQRIKRDGLADIKRMNKKWNGFVVANGPNKPILCVSFTISKCCARNRISMRNCCCSRMKSRFYSFYSSSTPEFRFNGTFILILIYIFLGWTVFFFSHPSFSLHECVFLFQFPFFFAFARREEKLPSRTSLHGKLITKRKRSEIEKIYIYRNGQRNINTTTER